MTPKVLTLDIETSPLVVYTWGLHKQEISIGQIIEPTRMLSWAAKWYGKKPVLFRSEFHDGALPMVQELCDLIAEADVLVHFNGASFDMKHIRREAEIHGLTPPTPVPEVDLLRIARQTFYLPSYKLDWIAQYFGVGAKVSHTGFSLWRDCLAGDDKAWALMRKYNKGDVVVTERVFDKLRPYIKGAHFGLLAGEYNACSRCGSTRLQRRGVRASRRATYARYQCQDCGGWSQGKHALASVDARGVA